MSVVLITGASGAIGSACVRIFAENGYNVVAQYYTNKTKAENLSAELNAHRKFSCEPIYADITDETSVNALFKQAYGIFPSLDVLVCSAGIARYGLINDISVNDWDEVFNVNAKGTFLCCREALKYMRKKNGGKIITVSSVWGIAGAADEAAYAASKGAVIAFTKSLAKEASEFNISVNCVAPGAIYSNMLNKFTEEEIEEWAANEIPLKKIGRPKDAAQSVFFLACAAADYITGQVISPNGGLLI